jgi:hypothetical protein
MKKQTLQSFKIKGGQPYFLSRELKFALQWAIRILLHRNASKNSFQLGLFTENPETHELKTLQTA